MPGQTASELDKLGIQEVHADGSVKSIASIQGNLLQAGSWDASASKLRFINQSTLPAWHIASQGGYDRTQPATAIKNGIEVVRDYTDAQGKPIDTVTVGDEIDVHVRIRATGADGIGNVSVVDLLPGGFEPVIEPPPAATDQQSADSSDSSNSDASSNGNDAADADNDNKPATPAWRSPIGLSQSTWQLDYADIREDRVVIYGTATPRCTRVCVSHQGDQRRQIRHPAGLRGIHVRPCHTGPFTRRHDFDGRRQALSEHRCPLTSVRGHRPIDMPRSIHMLLKPLGALDIALAELACRCSHLHRGACGLPSLAASAIAWMVAVVYRRL